jgi:hypothetical protein
VSVGESDWRLSSAGTEHAFDGAKAGISVCGNMTRPGRNSKDRPPFYQGRCQRCIEIADRRTHLTTDEWTEKYFKLFAEDVDAHVSMLTDLEGDKAYTLRRFVMISLRHGRQGGSWACPPQSRARMGAYQWCHDCKSWGVPRPFVDEVVEHRKEGSGALRCGNCLSENVAHYECLLDRRDGEIQHGDEVLDLRSFDYGVNACTACQKRDVTLFEPVSGMKYYLCAGCLRKAADSCDAFDRSGL